MNINDLKPGVVFEFESQPWKVLKATHVHMGRGGAVVLTKMKNLITGRVQDKAFRPRDEVKEADISTRKILYLYNSKGQFWFCQPNDKSKRFFLSEENVGDAGKFLKANMEVDAVEFHEQIVGIEVPIKMTFKVLEAPPAIKGDTQGSVTKEVKIETGAYVAVPIFVKEGDSIVINTQTGEYVERA